MTFELLYPEVPRANKTKLQKLINNLSTPGFAQVSNTPYYSLLKGVEIPEQFHGQVLAIYFNYIRKMPDIVHEIKPTIEERWDYETAAFKSRALKFLHR